MVVNYLLMKMCLQIVFHTLNATNSLAVNLSSNSVCIRNYDFECISTFLVALLIGFSMPKYVLVLRKV